MPDTNADIYQGLLAHPDSVRVSADGKMLHYLINGELAVMHGIDLHLMTEAEVNDIFCEHLNYLMAQDTAN